MFRSQSLGSVPEIYQDALCMSQPLHSFHLHVYGHKSQMDTIITDVACVTSLNLGRMHETATNTREELSCGIVHVCTRVFS